MISAAQGTGSLDPPLSTEAAHVSDRCSYWSTRVAVSAIVHKLKKVEAVFFFKFLL